MRGSSDCLRSLKKYVSLGVDRAHPRRLPLYVYGDAAFDAPSEQREPHDFARVMLCETSALVEAEDPRRAIVVC